MASRPPLPTNHHTQMGSRSPSSSQNFLDDEENFPPSISQRYPARTPRLGAKQLDLRGQTPYSNHKNNNNDKSQLQSRSPADQGVKVGSSRTRYRTTPFPDFQPERVNSKPAPRIGSSSNTHETLQLPMEEPRTLRQQRSFERTRAWAAEIEMERRGSRAGSEETLSSEGQSGSSLAETTLASPKTPRTALQPHSAIARPSPAIVASESPPANLRTPAAPVLSIDEIIKLHSAGVNGAMTAAKDKARKELGLAPGALAPTHPTESLSLERGIKFPTTNRVPSASRDGSPATHNPLNGDSIPSPAPRIGTPKIASSDQGIRSPHRTASTTRNVSSPSPPPFPTPEPIPVPEPPRNIAHEMALHLRSPSLNQFFTFPRPFPDRPLRVSYADVGDPNGRPVLIFLGLGCVRYLIALFDGLARAFGLRLICVDRWGYGKTDQVDAVDRGLVEWSTVMGQVCKELGIQKCQIVAHSCGAPYALAMARRWPEMIRGSVQLLAPWIGQQHDGVHKWLKWVPGSVIKTATAADHRIQSIFIGKAPKLAFAPVSFDARAAAAAAAGLTSSGGNPSASSTPSRTTPSKKASKSQLRQSEDGISAASTPSLIHRASTAFKRKPPSIYGSIGAAASTASLILPTSASGGVGTVDKTMFSGSSAQLPLHLQSSSTSAPKLPMSNAVHSQSRTSLSIGPGSSFGTQSNLGRSPALQNLRTLISPSRQKRMSTRPSRSSLTGGEGHASNHSNTHLSAPPSFDSINNGGRGRSDTPASTTLTTTTESGGPMTPHAHSALKVGLTGTGRRSSGNEKEGEENDDDGDHMPNPADFGLEGFDTFGTELRLVWPSLMTGNSISLDKHQSKAIADETKKEKVDVNLEPSSPTASMSSGAGSSSSLSPSSEETHARKAGGATTTTTSTPSPITDQAVNNQGSTSPDDPPIPTTLGEGRYPSIPEFALALQQAAHAECEPGTTSDILRLIVNRPYRPWGFKVEDVRVKSTVWWGTEDKLISEKSVEWMEVHMGSEVLVRHGQGHGLLSCPTVVCELFQRLGAESRED